MTSIGALEVLNIALSGDLVGPESEALSSFLAELDAVAPEFRPQELRWWLPKHQAVEQIAPRHLVEAISVRLEQSYESRFFCTHETIEELIAARSFLSDCGVYSSVSLTQAELSEGSLRRELQEVLADCDGISAHGPAARIQLGRIGEELESLYQDAVSVGFRSVDLDFPKLQVLGGEDSQALIKIGHELERLFGVWMSVDNPNIVILLFYKIIYLMKLGISSREFDAYGSHAQSVYLCGAGLITDARTSETRRNDVDLVKFLSSEQLRLRNEPFAPTCLACPWFGVCGSGDLALGRFSAVDRQMVSPFCAQLDNIYSEIAARLVKFGLPLKVLEENLANLSLARLNGDVTDPD